MVPALLAPHRRREEHVGARGGVGGERADRDRRTGPRSSAARRSAAVGEVRQRVGAEQHERVDRAVGRGLEDAGGVEPACAGTLPTRRRSASRPASRVTRPGRKPGVRPRSSAPCTLPRRSAERNFTSGSAASAAAACTTDAGDSASDWRPSTTTMSPSRPSSAADRAARSDRRPTRCRRPRAHGRTAAAIAPASPGGWRSTAVASRVSPVARGAISIERHAEVDRGAAHAQVQDRELVLEVGREQHDAARAVEVGDRGARAGRARPRRGGRRRAARRRCRCRARPWRGAPTRRRPRSCRARRRAPRSTPGRGCRARAAARRPRRRAPPATTPRRARRSCAPSARARGRSECTHS